MQIFKRLNRSSTLTKRISVAFQAEAEIYLYEYICRIRAHQKVGKCLLPVSYAQEKLPSFRKKKTFLVSTTLDFLLNHSSNKAY